MSSAVDEESRLWLRRLRAPGVERDRAQSELHGLLLRAARFEASRRRAAGFRLDARELDDLAVQAADDALAAIVSKLDQFRGEARFTTWAYKFALLEAAVHIRRRAWQGREIPLEFEHTLLPGAQRSPVADIETRELIAAVGDGIGGSLTPHQRQILVAITLHGVPIDVLAERLGTNRGALYKTLHDARRRLRDYLSSRGFDISHIGESDSS